MNLLLATYGGYSPRMIELRDLTYRIGARKLLDSAGACIPAGARVGLVGRNGSGKTTLFRLKIGRASCRERV